LNFYQFFFCETTKRTMFCLWLFMSLKYKNSLIRVF